VTGNERTTKELLDKACL